MDKTYANRYIAKKRFPLFISNETEVKNLARKYLRKRFDVSERLAQLENPVDVMEKTIRLLNND
jgi:hypothetical protein